MFDLFDTCYGYLYLLTTSNWELQYWGSWHYDLVIILLLFFQNALRYVNAIFSIVIDFYIKAVNSATASNVDHM
jgi:hypothetical protein